MTRHWLRDERSDVAAQRILDAAAELFRERGVAAAGMADVAHVAGCSRATLYRYFDGRRALHLAFVHREARRVASRVAAEVQDITDPTERTTAAMLAAIREVRADPTLIAWFRQGDVGLAHDIIQSSDVIESLGESFLAGLDEPHNTRLAAWLVRVIVSLLALPGRDEDEERALLEKFVAPLIGHHQPS